MADFSLNIEEKVGIAPEVRKCFKMIEGKLVEMGASGTEATAVEKITVPAEATTEQIATKVNEIIDALVAHNILK